MHGLSIHLRKPQTLTRPILAAPSKPLLLLLLPRDGLLCCTRCTYTRIRLESLRSWGGTAQEAATAEDTPQDPNTCPLLLQRRQSLESWLLL